MRTWGNSVTLAPGEKPWVRPMPNNAKQNKHKKPRKEL